MASGGETCSDAAYFFSSAFGSGAGVAAGAVEAGGVVLLDLAGGVLAAPDFFAVS